MISPKGVTRFVRVHSSLRKTAKLAQLIGSVCAKLTAWTRVSKMPSYIASSRNWSGAWRKWRLTTTVCAPTISG